MAAGKAVNHSLPHTFASGAPVARKLDIDPKGFADSVLNGKEKAAKVHVS